MRKIAIVLFIIFFLSNPVWGENTEQIDESIPVTYIDLVSPDYHVNSTRKNTEPSDKYKAYVIDLQRKLDSFSGDTKASFASTNYDWEYSQLSQYYKTIVQEYGKNLNVSYYATTNLYVNHDISDTTFCSNSGFIYDHVESRGTEYVTSQYGDKRIRMYCRHKGIDLGTPDAPKPIYALISDNDKAYPGSTSNAIRIVDIYGVIWNYRHNSINTSTHNNGNTITIGTDLGHSGEMGTGVTQPIYSAHLHIDTEIGNYKYKLETIVAVECAISANQATQSFNTYGKLHNIVIFLV